MNIVFSWVREDGEYTPRSQSDLVNSDGLGLLDCVLMDDGGLPYWETTPWLYEGLKMIESVTIGKSEACDWSRETWGVHLSRENAKIYSLYEEGCFQVVSIVEFSKVLAAWVDFIQSKPNVDNPIVIQLNT